MIQSFFKPACFPKATNPNQGRTIIIRHLKTWPDEPILKNIADDVMKVLKRTPSTYVTSTEEPYDLLVLSRSDTRAERKFLKAIAKKGLTDTQVSAIEKELKPEEFWSMLG